MAEESSNYNSKFENEVKSAVVGEKNIIYNYFYYRESPERYLVRSLSNAPMIKTLLTGE